jgi:hypothetical protein
MKNLIILLTLTLSAQISFSKELVYLSGAIGSTPTCAEKECGLCGVWEAYPCIAKLLVEESFPNDTFMEHSLHPFAKESEFKRTLNYEICPRQLLYANENPMYTQTRWYMSFSGPIGTRWGVWLITDNVTNTATLSMMLQSKSGGKEWCNDEGVNNKWCKWYNYTINDCGETYNTSSKPVVSIYAVPNQMSTFGTVQNFDVLYQNCSNRCGIANLSCCDSYEEVFASTPYRIIRSTSPESHTDLTSSPNTTIYSTDKLGLITTTLTSSNANVNVASLTLLTSISFLARAL